jgi:hypothetical protein
MAPFSRSAFGKFAVDRARPRWAPIAVLRASIEWGGSGAALSAMESMAVELEGSVLRGVIGAEMLDRPAAATGFERRMEQIAHALRNAIAFRDC